MLFSIVVSNDSLAMLLGTLAILAALRFTREPSTRNAVICGVIAGLGLLTKGTLIPHAGVLFLVIARTKKVQWMAIFVSIAIVLGSYKFIENEQHLGRPIVHGMDFNQLWIQSQRPTITSAYSWIDVNPVKLWREPYAPANPHSAPLLLYATFWHPYDPVSNFRTVRLRAPIVGRLTYVFAIVPTLLILIGLRKRPLLALFLAANVAVVLVAGAKYDAWSCFQSRLFFPSFAAIALAYAEGIERTARRWRWPVDVMCIALYALFLADFEIEIFHVIATHLQ